jgi:hypothetical protein
MSKSSKQSDTSVKSARDPATGGKKYNCLLKGHDLPVKDTLEQIKNNFSHCIKGIDYNSDAKSITVHYHNV